MNIIQQLEQEQIAKLTEGKSIHEFSPGDTVKVNVKVIEGNRERVVPDGDRRTPHRHRWRSSASHQVVEHQPNCCSTANSRCHIGAKPS